MNLIDDEKPVDFVLVHPVRPEYFEDFDESRKWKAKERLRVLFEDAMFRENLLTSEEIDGDKVFVKIHCPFSRLCQEAERIKLEMPLKVEADEKNEHEQAARVIEMLFKVDQKPSRYLSAPFRVLIADQFLGYDSPDMFFRSSQRNLLVHYILNNINIQDKLADDGIGSVTNKGLAYIMMKKAYSDFFVLHDRTLRNDPEQGSQIWNPAEESNKTTHRRVSLLSTISNINDDSEYDKKGPFDTRAQLTKSWFKFFKRQPLWLIRNYFGEKIGFYFAWEGTLISSLVMPAILGVIIFGVGVPVAIKELDHGQVFFNQSSSSSISAHMNYYLEVLKLACDNIVTPWFAFIICLWGTIFLEIWKRVRSTQSFRWGVDHFHEDEPIRPEFQPTHVRYDPVLDTNENYYPVYLKMIKYSISFLVSALMICVVLISVTFVIIFRLYIVTDYCPNSEICQFTLATLAPAIMNTVSILILGKIYSIIAETLNDWENHRTKSEYNSALIIKLFAFQFANTYASLFYLAFIRGRYANFSFLNLEYVDSCCERSCHGAAATADGNCMSMLTFQVLVLMLVKPFPRFFKDIILPGTKNMIRKFCKNNKVSNMKKGMLLKEMLKPKINEFTREELTEKVVLYGFLMLFAASFPLAPLIALVTITLDLRIDSHRLLWFNQRPIAYRYQGIGIWYEILQFINLCGVISNGLLITYTSSSGKRKTDDWKFLFFICFEHAVFGVRFLITKLIPDVPQQIRQAQRKEKFLVTQSLIEGMKKNFEEKMEISAKRNSFDVSDDEMFSLSPNRNSKRKKYQNIFKKIN